MGKKWSQIQGEFGIMYVGNESCNQLRMYINIEISRAKMSLHTKLSQLYRDDLCMKDFWID